MLPIPGLEQTRRPDMITRFAVNLIVARDAAAGAPVVDESHPTYSNLIGKIERRAHLGVMYTDFTEIRAGAMLQANGGYLILQALISFASHSGEALKRVIKTGAVTIEDPAEFTASPPLACDLNRFQSRSRSSWSAQRASTICSRPTKKTFPSCSK